MAQTHQATVEGSVPLRRTPGIPDGSGMPYPSDPAWLSDRDAAHRHHVAGAQRIYQRRSRHPLSGALVARPRKQPRQRDILRGKTPELVRKELWTHILAYNLIRAIVAQAATKH